MKKLYILITLAFLPSTLIAQCPQHVHISSQADISNLFENYPNCSVIPGNLVLQNQSATVQITDISQLSRITEVVGSVIIYDIVPTNLNGLSNLQSIGVSLIIRENNNLTNLSGLNSLHTIKDNLYIINNSLFNSFSGAPNLRNLGGLGIFGNTAFKSISGMDNVTTLNGSNYISNSHITNFNGLGHLTSIGNLQLNGNLFLTDISAFKKTTLLNPGSTIISGNSGLSDCAIKMICDNIRYVYISGNGTDCGSTSEVDAICQTALPISLIHFAGTSESNIVTLSWTTSSEVNGKQFEIQHSQDGKDWKIIGSITSHAESETIKKYQFIHESPSIGNNYYRLKMIDGDGSFAYSKLTSIVISIDNLTVKIPNPVSRVLPIDGRYIGFLELLDKGGNLLLKEEIASQEVQSVNIEGINQGLYIMKVTGRNGSIETKKLVIQ